MQKITLLLFTLCFICSTGYAQYGRSTARHYIKKGVEQKMDSTYRKKGKKSVEDITYKNDKRYKDPSNKVQATITYIDSSFKKERVKYVTSSSMIFGKKGEAYVTRNELKPEEPDQQWFVFNYAEKANYIVTPKTKEAIKMPLINFKKMIERAAEKAAEKEEEDSALGIQPTNEYTTILGYRSRKFVRVNDNGDTTLEEWVSTGPRLNLGSDYMMGARLNTYKFPANPKYKEMADGFVMRLVQYDKKGRVKYTRTLSRFDKGKADEKYFDLSAFKVSDVLGGL